MTDADKLVEEIAVLLWEKDHRPLPAWELLREPTRDEFRSIARPIAALAVERCAEVAETAHEKVFLEPTPSHNLVAIKAASLIRALSPNAKGET